MPLYDIRRVIWGMLYANDANPASKSLEGHLRHLRRLQVL